jgi:hypothetical protein
MPTTEVETRDNQEKNGHLASEENHSTHGHSSETKTQNVKSGKASNEHRASLDDAG